MGRPFHFHLQRVLEYRTHLEEQAKMVMARAQRAYQEQVEAVERVRGSLEAHLATQAESQTSSGAMYLWRSYKRRLEEDLRAAELHMLELAQEVNRRRRELVAASKERKIMEKYKENLEKRHVQEEQHKEQAEFDEAATIRYRPPAF